MTQKVVTDGTAEDTAEACEQRCACLFLAADAHALRSCARVSATPSVVCFAPGSRGSSVEAADQSALMSLASPTASSSLRARGREGSSPREGQGVCREAESDPARGWFLLRCRGSEGCFGKIIRSGFDSFRKRKILSKSRNTCVG